MSDNIASKSIKIDFVLRPKDDEDEDDDGDDGGQSHQIWAELDEEKNEGKSTFEPGDTVYMRVFTWPENMVLSTESTAGQVTGAPSPGNVVRTKQPETLTFNGISEKDEDEDENEDESEKEEKKNTASTSKPVSGGVSTHWLSASLGNLTFNGTEVVASSPRRGVCAIMYDSKYRRYILEGVSESAITAYQQFQEGAGVEEPSELPVTITFTEN